MTVGRSRPRWQAVQCGRNCIRPSREYRWEINAEFRSVKGAPLDPKNLAVFRAGQVWEWKGWGIGSFPGGVFMSAGGHTLKTIPHRNEASGSLYFLRKITFKQVEEFPLES